MERTCGNCAYRHKVCGVSDCDPGGERRLWQPLVDDTPRPFQVGDRVRCGCEPEPEPEVTPEPRRLWNGSRYVYVDAAGNDLGRFLGVGDGCDKWDESKTQPGLEMLGTFCNDCAKIMERFGEAIQNCEDPAPPMLRDWSPHCRSGNR